MNMKKALLLLAIICIVSCVNSTKDSSTSDVDSVEVIEEVFTDDDFDDTSCDCDVCETAGSTEVTLDFSSYHLYTCEEDKYDASGYQPISAKVTIDEESSMASLKLYDSGEKRWFIFAFRIDEKVHLQEGVITYIVYNNANQRGYIYISTNRPNGLFIDINNFVYDGETICCWMQEGGSSGSEYRQETVTIESTPNTYSTPDYSSTSSTSFHPSISSGSLHSDERITGSYSNYEETDNCVEGVVVYEGDDDYYIVQTRKGFTVLERYSGSLWEGHKVRGELNRYGTKYLINRNRDSEVRVHIEEYMLTEDDAIEWLGEHDHLDDDDQEAYNANNQ